MRSYLRYPRDAATTDLDSPFSVFKWEIETLLTLLLTTSKASSKRELYSTQSYVQYGLLRNAVSLLRDVETHESGTFLNPDNVLLEMHRIGHRQFGWQRGFATGERLYRFAYVYGQGACANYFEATYGLTIQEFLKIGFVFFVQLQKYAWTKAVQIDGLALDVAHLERALPLFARSLEETRADAQALVAKARKNRTAQTAYLPSSLRRFPIITAPEHGAYIAPLPQLIMLRMTAGLYYDIAGGPGNLITEANNRFEEYARLVIKGFFPRFDVLPSQRYGPKKAAVDTPDILIRDGEEVVGVIECKATKLTHEAQFAENPMEAADQAYSQVVKGITQLWKFFSDVRRGVFSAIPVANSAHGILLTMDAWMQTSAELQAAAIALAKIRVEHDQEITESDMRPVIFCAMQEVADIMFISDEDQFLATLGNAAKEEFKGWPLREVRRSTADEGEGRAYPLDTNDLLPWWGNIRDADGKHD
ncbi:hypothetical protein [Rhizobium rhizogenes]|uniref:hypothetical protein n=1 Tax=Rhizobium rhizogenes TaxID=359 RepID=UPI00123B17E5|nr:hypothetical protein [Rhizobium rhizogenes]